MSTMAPHITTGGNVVKIITDVKGSEAIFGATQRLAISRMRDNGMDTIERESLALPPNAKMGQTEHVGCMAVFGGRI